MGERRSREPSTGRPQGPGGKPLWSSRPLIRRYDRRTTAAASSRGVILSENMDTMLTFNTVQLVLKNKAVYQPYFDCLDKS